MSLKINKFPKWKHFDYLLLAILFVIGFCLRIYLIDKNLFFGPEQGRDMLVVKEIVTSHKLVLIGPKTAVEGIFHGPLYYYLAAIPFAVSKGNPLVIALFFIFLNSLSVFFIFLLGKELFNRRVGIISSLLFTFSFGAVAMARWFSHPPLIILIGSLFFLALTRFIKGKNKYLIPTVILYGLSAQTEFSNLIIFTFILFFTVVVFWKRFAPQKIIYLIIAFLLAITLPIFNFILFDLRHNNLILNSMIKSQAHRPEFLGYFSHTLIGSFEQFIKVFSDVILLQHPIITILIFVLALAFLLKSESKNKDGVRIILIWLFSPFIAFILLRYNPLYHYFTASIVVIIILTAVFINYIISFRKILGFTLISLLILLNLYSLYLFLPKNIYFFFQTTQTDLRYEDQKAVIEKIYKEADGTPFYYQAYTIPYWMQDGWRYLFWYYGLKHGYIPVHMDKGLLFVIIQNDPSTKLYQTNWLKDTVSHWGRKEGEFKYGALRVQKLIVE